MNYFANIGYCDAGDSLTLTFVLHGKAGFWKQRRMVIHDWLCPGKG